jgi:hypothetical protein
VVSFTHQPLYPQGNSPCYSLDGRLGGPQSQSGLGSKEKNSQLQPGLEPLIIQPAVQRYAAELPQLLSRGIYEPKRGKVQEGWRRLHNEELHNLYTSPNVIRVIE